ncbi:nucleotidyltransferase domain-containing protein [Lysinibacillus sp. NPDC093197]|uniref:type VII toxin-antitoxin system MntA family adenylyltransferase antitoxin n=1 Tax=Lysinibacillus sp. NPDC093197 TaxID=3364132 RepID=UPI0037FDCBF6
MLSKELKNTIKEVLQARVQPSFILLFGSHAKGVARGDSDLDIAYFSETILTNYERFLLAGDLAEKCHVDVDLVDLQQVDTVFVAQIFSTGILLNCVDDNEFIKQRMKAYSMYATLNEQRTEILQGIKERGSVLDES